MGIKYIVAALLFTSCNVSSKVLEKYNNDNFSYVGRTVTYEDEVVAKLKAIEALGLNEEIQDITITLSSQIHIINIAPSGAYFVYLAVDSKDANLGITKALSDN